MASIFGSVNKYSAIYIYPRKHDLDRGVLFNIVLQL